MNKKFYLYVQRYLLNFVVDLNTRTPFDTVLTQLSTYSNKNQSNTSFNSFKLKIDPKYSTKGIETLNFKKNFFVQKQYKLSRDLLYVPYLKTLETTVYSNYSFLHGLSRLPFAQHLTLGGDFGCSGGAKGRENRFALGVDFGGPCRPCSLLCFRPLLRIALGASEAEGRPLSSPPRGLWPLPKGGTIPFLPWAKAKGLGEDRHQQVVPKAGRRSPLAPFSLGQRPKASGRGGQEQGPKGVECFLVPLAPPSGGKPPWCQRQGEGQPLVKGHNLTLRLFGPKKGQTKLWWGQRQGEAQTLVKDHNLDQDSCFTRFFYVNSRILYASRKINKIIYFKRLCFILELCSLGFRPLGISFLPVHRKGRGVLAWPCSASSPAQALRPLAFPSKSSRGAKGTNTRRKVLVNAKSTTKPFQILVNCQPHQRLNNLGVLILRTTTNLYLKAHRNYIFLKPLALKLSQYPEYYRLWSLTFRQSPRFVAYHQDQTVLPRPRFFNHPFETKPWSCVKDGQSFTTNDDKFDTPLVDLITQLSPPKFFRHSEYFRFLSDNDYENKFVSKIKSFNPFIIRVAKDQVHQSPLNPCQKLFSQNQILLSSNFFLFFNLLKAYKKYKIMLNQKILSKKHGIRKVGILVEYWSQRNDKVYTFLKLTSVDKVMTNKSLPSKPIFRERQGVEGFWSPLGAKLPPLPPLTLGRKGRTRTTWPWWCQRHHQGHRSRYRDHREMKGRKNLRPIKSVNLHNFILFRPLLTLTRLDSFYICESLKLPIYPDKSNNQVKFLRNRVRKQILPAIRILLNPQFDTLFCKFSESYTQS